MKWPTRELGDFAVARGGSVDPAKHPTEEFDLYSIPAFDAGNPEVARGTEIGSSKKVVQTDDVLLSRIVPHIRRAWIVGHQSSRRQIASGEWIIFRGKEIWPNYVKHFLVSDPFHRQFMLTVSGVGGSLLRARPTEVYKIEIPLPPLTEQKRIAAILDAADDLRTKRRESLSQLDALLQSTFLDMFGDPDGSEWEMAKIADVIEDRKGSIRTGPFGSQLLHSEFVDAGVAVLGIDNAVQNEFQWRERRFISPSKYRQLERYTVFPGDVLITIMGTCGRCAIVPEDIPTAINTKHLCCITLDWSKCFPEFLHSYFLLHPIARQYLIRTAKGSIMDGLNMGIIKSMPIPLAPIALQSGFVRIFREIHEQKRLYRTQIEELDTLFASLQSRAFRGEL